MTDTFQPWALDITTAPDIAFDLADALGMEGDMSALSVTIFDAPENQMLVQALYENEVDAKRAKSTLDLSPNTPCVISRLPAKDWVSETQAGLSPVRAGRFFVYGSHDWSMQVWLLERGITAQRLAVCVYSMISWTPT